MDIAYPCPQCGCVLSVPEEHLGRSGTCNKCGKKVVLLDKRVACPACGVLIFVPDQRAGLSGKCLKCGSHFTFVQSGRSIVPKTDAQIDEERAAEGARQERLQEVGKIYEDVEERLAREEQERQEAQPVADQGPKSGRTPYAAVAPPGKIVMELPVYRYVVRVTERKTGFFRKETTYHVSELPSSDEFDRFYGTFPVPNAEEAREFVLFMIRQASFKHLLAKKRWYALNIACATWLCLRHYAGEDGRLTKSIKCIGFNAGSIRCGNNTKDPQGLCRHHKRPGASTMWNSEWWSDTDNARERAEEHQAWVENERTRRQNRWKAKARKITYTATDTQIYFLLDLGATPSQLHGITKKQASEERVPFVVEGGWRPHRDSTLLAPCHPVALCRPKHLDEL